MPKKLATTLTVGGEEESPLLRDGDLFIDREVRTNEDDRFGHRRIADQVVELVTTVEAPANIALYGAWGSGKSGVSNLVEARLAKHAGYRFVRFDAFKYAKNPLRRNFISAVASGLGHRGDEFHRDLYVASTETDVNLPAKKLWGVSKVVLSVICGAVALTLVFSMAAAFAGDGKYWSDFKELMQANLWKAIAAASPFAVIITLINNVFTFNRTSTRPESDEEFESIFSKLVADSKAKRLIIFVDELDRCAPGDVVETLGTVRTFFGVENCIFVVAADQQVLEHALDKSLEQATPTDLQNPYYSTGSEYLDKVFQYQVSLPDLMPPNITQYAIELARTKSIGLWSELADAEFVISLLVPSHVVSPRRVKHLLNAYALAYRLAEDRHENGELDESPKVFARPLAKLVCLRVEFPVFARALTTDPDLIEHVLMASDNPNLLEENSEHPFGAKVTPEAEATAMRFVRESTAPGPILATGNDLTFEAEANGDSGFGRQLIIESQRRQLLAYLRRTRRSGDPSRDLIFMKSEPSFTTLESSVAKDLLDSAIGNDVDTVKRLFTDGSIQEDEQGKALSFLVRRIRHTYGVEQVNMATVVLALATQAPSLSFESTAGVFLGEIANIIDEAITPEVAEGAWRIALQTDGEEAAVVQKLIINRLVATVDAPFEYILKSPLQAMVDPKGTRTLLARGLVHQDPASTLATIRSMSKNERASLLELVDSLPAEFDQVLEAHTSWLNLPEDQRTEETAEPRNPHQNIKAIVEAGKELGSDDPETAVRFGRMILDIDDPGVISDAFALLGLAEPTRDAVLAKTILLCISWLPFEEWEGSLALIKPDDQVVAQDQMQRLAQELCSNLESSNEIDKESLERAAKAVAAFSVNSGLEIPDISAIATKDIAATLVADEQISDHEASDAMVQILVSSGLVSSRSRVDALRVSVISSLEQDIAASPEMIAYLSSIAKVVFANEASKEDISEEARQLLTILGNDHLLRGAARISLLSQLVKIGTDEGHDFSALLTEIDELTGVIETEREHASGAVANWLSASEISPREAEILLTALDSNGVLNRSTAQAMGEITTAWSGTDQLNFIAPHIRNPKDQIPDRETLIALGFSSAPRKGIAELIIERYNNSSNADQRSAVLKLWKNADFQEHSIRVMLFKSIVLPMLRLTSNRKPNESAIRSVLNEVGGLGGVPNGVKREFNNAVVDAVNGNKQLEDFAQKKLKALNTKLTKSKRGLFSQRNARIE